MAVFAGQKIKVTDLYSEGTWTPVVTQSNTPTLTINHATYTRIGSRCFGNMYVTMTSAGTANNFILLTLPFPCLTTIATSFGAGYVQTAASNYPFVSWRNSSTTVALMATGFGAAPTYVGATAPANFALAIGDKITMEFNYQTS